MIDFITVENRLENSADFKVDDFRDFIHFDADSNSAIMFSYWDKDQYHETSFGRGNNRVTKRELFTPLYNPINLDTSSDKLYRYENVDAKESLMDEPKDYLVKELGLHLIGNHATFYRFVDKSKDSDIHRTADDGRSIDLSVGNRAVNGKLSGLVTEIARHADRYTFVVDGNIICVHENARVTV